MTLYARSDLMSVSIPATSGGCGQSHSRPVRAGAPVKTWALTCPDGCESYLRGEKKAKVIQVIPGDKDRGIPSQMKHVADSDPHWSTTPEGVPQTPDERQVHRVRSEQGQRQLETLSAFAALKQANVTIPAQAQWVVDKILEEIAQREMGSLAIQGVMVCASGHENAPGAKFCNSCGLKMDGKLAIGNPKGQEVDVEVVQEDFTMGGYPSIRVDAMPLRTLHVATLKKMARDKGLSDKGKKEDLIARLEA